MHRTATALLVAAGLSLTACSSDPDLTPTIDAAPSSSTAAAPSSTYRPPAPRITTDREAFLDEMRDEGITDTYAVTESDMTTLGNAMCTALGAGTTPVAIRQMGVDNGMPRSTADTILDAAIIHLCPQHDDKLED
jgi:hypothetical protein